MNAHINYDLGLTIDDVGIDPNRSQKYADHQRIDDILTRLVDAQQRALAELYASGIEESTPRSVDSTSGSPCSR